MARKKNAAVPIRVQFLYEDLQTSMAALRKDQGRLKASRARVETALTDGKAHYGINTGFGALAQKRIADDQVVRLQRNLILSHTCGVGDPVPKTIARLMLQLKIHALGLGYSGISLETFQRLLDFEEKDLVSVIPSRGSVGASGDLAPLAHMCLPLLGLGHFWSPDGKGSVEAETALKAQGMAAIELQAKDGLALINGTQLMSAYGAAVLESSLQLLKYADLLGAMSLEALQGSITPFDERVQDVRPHPGQKEAAANMRALLKGSEILESHRDCGKVQDPYSLRCIPQVHGACRDALHHAVDVVQIELNSVTDNPLVFDNGDIISAGNFHGEPLALAMDYAAIALAELASISERRTYLLLGGHDGLPTLLMRDTGLNSGFMIPQYTAAALVSENKVLCHPASTDSIPTSLGQEDHVSMGSISALKLYQVFRNVRRVLGIELLTAAQALDFRSPLRPGRGVEIAHQCMRETVAHVEADYRVGDDLERCAGLLRGGDLLRAVEKELGSLL